MARQPDRYIAFLIEQFGPLGEITQRALFGGHCLYCDGVVFALVANAELYLKADALTIPAFESRSLKAFQSMKYYQAPAEIFEDDAAMKTWVGGAIACGERAKKQSARSRE